jgi:hypothetical protein
MMQSPPQEPCGAQFFCGVSRKFFFLGFQEHGRQGYFHDFGREKTLNPTWIPSRLQSRKIVNPTFSGDKSFFPQKFNSKTVSFTFV